MSRRVTPTASIGMLTVTPPVKVGLDRHKDQSSSTGIGTVPA